MVNSKKISFPNSPFLSSGRVDPFFRFMESEEMDVVLCENSHEADYIFLYPNRLKEFYECCYQFQEKVIIFVTGEAVAPDFNLVDYAFAYDHLDYGDRYFQVYFQNTTYEYDLADITNSDEILKNKNKFCNFIYSNKRAHHFRDEFFQKLCARKSVDSLGSHLRNVETKIAPPYKGDWFLESVREKSQYKFSISFENAKYAGYTTEKILTSMLAKTIPIYWGNKHVSKLYNPKSFINCHDYDGVEQIIDKIIELDSDDNKYAAMLAQPWQTLEQKDLSKQRNKALIERINMIFNQPIKEAFRKPTGCWADIYRDNLCKPKEENLGILKSIKSKLRKLV